MLDNCLFLLASLKKALLGSDLNPDIISCNIGHDSIELNFWFEEMPTENEFEAVDIIETEILSDYQDLAIKCNCRHKSDAECDAILKTCSVLLRLKQVGGL